MFWQQVQDDLADGHHVEGFTRRGRCSACSLAERVLALFRPCFCDTGKDLNGMPCPRCGGTGLIPTSHLRLICDGGLVSMKDLAGFLFGKE